MSDFENIEFSPILIMEFIRQVTAGRVMAAENPDLKVSFRIKKSYYDEMRAYPLQVQFINLVSEYDEDREILAIGVTDGLISHFKEYKSLIEISSKYEEQYSERYKAFIEVV
jgi:hypothetical protein